MSQPALQIRLLQDADLSAAFSIIVQLREQLDAAEFERRVQRQRALGYELHGAFDDRGALVGVMGTRVVSTLARGEYLHVDDLVVDRALRGGGVGRSLMGYAEAWAMDRGFRTVFLDSRADALPFYTGLGYAAHTSTLVRKYLRPSSSPQKRPPSVRRSKRPS